MIDIIITSYGEPDSTFKCVDSFLNQDIKGDFRITVIDPFPEIEEEIKRKYTEMMKEEVCRKEGSEYFSEALERMH